MAAQNIAKITAVPIPSMEDRVSHRSGSSNHFRSNFRTASGMAVNTRKVDRNPTSLAWVANLEVFQELATRGGSVISVEYTTSRPAEISRANPILLLAWA